MKSNELILTVTAELPAFAPAVEELEARFSGQLIRPGDAAYEQARRLWNGRIDKYPALIARCRTAQDVVYDPTNFFRLNQNIKPAVKV